MFPSSHFVDHRQHDVGSGGGFKTPTLLNAKLQRALLSRRADSASYDEVVAAFYRQFSLRAFVLRIGADLIAYLTVIGDGEAR